MCEKVQGLQIEYVGDLTRCKKVLQVEKMGQIALIYSHISHIEKNLAESGCLETRVPKEGY